MSQADRWSLSTLRQSVRNELADPSGSALTKWTDAELNGYVGDWQDILQNDYEFCWGITTATLSGTGGGSQWNFFQWNGTAFNASGSSTSLATVTLANVASNILRPATVYFISTASGVASRLVPRNKLDLEIVQRDWRASQSYNFPTVVYQDDPSVLNLWPSPLVAGTLVLEYPVELSFTTDTSTMEIPAWCRYSARHYCAYRALMRFGATQNLGKAARYRRAWEQELRKISKVWNSYQPDRAEMLRPGGKWAHDILQPRTTLIQRI